MSIEHYIVKYLLKANEFVNKKLDFHTKNTNNIDEVIKEIVTNFINVDNFSELDDNLLYHHLKASKALAQLAWNSYRDHMCYNNCEIDENYFYQIFHHIENEEFYRNEFEKIKKGIKYSKTSIIEVISRYLITFCILISREVDVENKKICVYCDHVEIEDICSVCGGDKFDYKDVNCWPMEISTSNENKSSDKPEETNSNLKNETINCYKENLLNDECNEDNKLNLNSKYILKSKNDAAISEQFSDDKTNDCDQTDIYKIETRLSGNVVETSSYKESQLSSNLSNNIYEKSAKVERYENKDKENENLNKDSLLFWICGKCSFNRNEEMVQSCTSCMTVRMGSADNNENMSASTDRDSSLSRSNIDAMDTNQWICSKCSLINNKDDDICVLCYTNKSNADGTMNCYKENLSNVESIEDSKLHSNSKFIRKSENDAAISEPLLFDKTDIFKIESRSSDTIFDKESQLSSDLSNKNYVEFTKVEQFENLNKDKENKNSNKEKENNDSNDDCLWFEKCSKCSFNRNEEIVQSCTSCMKDRMNSADNNENMSSSPDINRDSSLSRSNIDAMDTNQWICSQCSLINNKDDDICELCYTNKSNADKYDLPEETWKCKKCNERNPFDCYKCYKCDDFSDFFDKWVCEQCSYFNHKLEWNCNVCNMKNQHLAKCPQCKKININIKCDDICFCCIIDKTLKKFSKLSINSDGDNDNMVKSNNISSMDSNNIDKKEINQWNYSSTNIERNQREMKINNLRFASNRYNRWYCYNPDCYGVNYKAVTYCDKCHLKKNSYPLNNNTDCVFYKNSREIKEWFCSKCRIFTNSSSSSCSRCNYHKMKVTTV